MNIAILSDIHDNIWKLQQALEWMETPGQQPDAMLICGDLCSPFVLGMIQSRFPKPIHLVFGNNDGDTFRTTSIAGEQVVIHGELAELSYHQGQLLPGLHEGAKLRIAINHFHDIAGALIQSSRYDLVCFGHNHKHHITFVDPQNGRESDTRKEGYVLSINPGALMGFDPLPPEAGQNLIPSTFVTLDLDTLEGRTQVME